MVNIFSAEANADCSQLNCSARFWMGLKNFDIYIRGYLDILLGTLYRYNLLNDMSEHYDSESIRRIWKAIEYIGEKYNEDISIDTLSSLLELNTEYFCRLFKKETGMTPKEYMYAVNTKSDGK